MKKIIIALLAATSLLAYSLEKEDSYSLRLFQSSPSWKIASESSEHYLDLDSPLKANSDGECPESVLAYTPQEMPMDTEGICIKSELVENLYSIPASLFPMLACMQLPIQQQQKLDIPLEKTPMPIKEDHDDVTELPNKRILKKTNDFRSYRIPGKYHCPQCGQQLSYKWGIKPHIDRIHGNLPKWSCPFLNDGQTNCRTTFISNSDYRRHLKKKHHTDYTQVGKLGLKKIKAFTKRSKEGSETYKSTVNALAQRPTTRSTTGSLKTKFKK
jgi:hypothetical protein